MTVNVQYFGNLREATGKEKENLELADGSVLSQLIDKLVEIYGPGYRAAMDSIKGLRILVDGRDSNILGGMNTPLKDGCTVVFLPPIAGG